MTAPTYIRTNLNPISQQPTDREYLLAIRELETRIRGLQRLIAEVKAAMPVNTPVGLVAYTHTQAVASSTWIINHNLGSRPIVELLSAGSMEFAGDIIHMSTNQVVCSFLSAVSGTARLL